MPLVGSDTRSVAVVGHRGAGKTALVSALFRLARGPAGKTGAAPIQLDTSPEERAHAATLETHVLQLTWHSTLVTLMDLPGELGFSADVRLALAAADAAVLVVSGRDGLQSGTERHWHWAREAKIPCLVVITKLDDDRARFDEVLAEIKSRLGTHTVVVGVPLYAGAALRGVADGIRGRAWIGPEAPERADGGEVPSEMRGAASAGHVRLVDDIASTDDQLVERYLVEGDLPPDDLDKALRGGIASLAVSPVFGVSATVPAGTVALLDALVRLVAPPERRAGSPGLFVFKTHIDPHTGRLSYARVISGELRPDMQLHNTTQASRERVGQVLQGFGGEMRSVDRAVAGDIVALPKLRISRSGDTITDEKTPVAFTPPPLPASSFERALHIENGPAGADDKVVAALQRLIEEDPGLSFGHEEATRELVVRGVSATHLDITVERIRRLTGLDCRLGPPKVHYRETITRSAMHVEGKLKKQTGGHGQFAVCYIDLEPQPRGTGFTFEDAVVGGSVPRQFIPSVEKGVRKALDSGILAGYPVVDIKVRLVDGKSHSVDSSDAAFQSAGYRAFRGAARAAAPVLLEPVIKLEVTLPSAVMGDAIGDLTSRRGRILGTDGSGDVVRISAHVPLAEILDYEPRLASMTHGKGSFSTTLDHYDPCPAAVTEKIAAGRASGADADED